MIALPPPSLRHLSRLTDDVGIVEHARSDRPRFDLGYCTDDAGRLLAVASTLREDPDAHRLATVALSFLSRAHNGDGTFKLRLRANGTWTEDAASDDASGRAVFGLGTAAVRAPWPDVRDRARSLFGAAVGFRSTHPRALGYAVLGAVEVLKVLVAHDGARQLVADAADLLPTPADGREWRWPEPRLTYANTLVPEVLLAVATTRADRRAATDALALLDWLVDEESCERGFSFVPVGGRGPGGPKPAFDQQPIEAWAMADACIRAFTYTGESRWADAARRAARWFVGDNDVGVAMFDPSTGGGFDGLERHGVNRNQGAESTLAFVATMAQAAGLCRAPSAGAPST